MKPKTKKRTNTNRFANSLLRKSSKSLLTPVVNEDNQTRSQKLPFKHEKIKNENTRILIDKHGHDHKSSFLKNKTCENCPLSPSIGGLSVCEPEYILSTKNLATLRELLLIDKQGYRPCYEKDGHMGRYSKFMGGSLKSFDSRNDKNQRPRNKSVPTRKSPLEKNMDTEAENNECKSNLRPSFIAESAIRRRELTVSLEDKEWSNAEKLPEKHDNKESKENDNDNENANLIVPRTRPHGSIIKTKARNRYFSERGSILGAKSDQNPSSLLPISAGSIPIITVEPSEDENDSSLLTNVSAPCPSTFKNPLSGTGLPPLQQNSNDPTLPTCEANRETEQNTLAVHQQDLAVSSPFKMKKNNPIHDDFGSDYNLSNLPSDEDVDDNGNDNLTMSSNDSLSYLRTDHSIYQKSRSKSKGEANLLESTIERQTRVDETPQSSNLMADKMKNRLSAMPQAINRSVSTRSGTRFSSAMHENNDGNRKTSTNPTNTCTKISVLSRRLSPSFRNCANAERARNNLRNNYNFLNIKGSSNSIGGNSARSIEEALRVSNPLSSQLNLAMPFNLSYYQLPVSTDKLFDGGRTNLAPTNSVCPSSTSGHGPSQSFLCEQRYGDSSLELRDSVYPIRNTFHPIMSSKTSAIMGLNGMNDTGKSDSIKLLHTDNDSDDEQNMNTIRKGKDHDNHQNTFSLTAHKIKRNRALRGRKRSTERSISNIKSLISKEQKVPRFMNKNGTCNIKFAKSYERNKKFFEDAFTTMVDLKWIYSLLIFISAYIISWIILSFLYWLIAWYHGQLYDPDVKNDMVLNKHNRCIESHKDKRCFINVDSYMRAFLFFVETDQTIGYGRRGISEHCPEAILVFVFQCLYGCLLDAIVMGCIFIKISRPKNKNEQLIFSEKACICLRNGKYCFMFRVGNLRNSMFVQCQIRAKLIHSSQTAEGEFLPMNQHDVNMGFDTGSDRLFLVTPLICYHIIDEKSPLWTFDYNKLKRTQFEIIVILEGTVESTGMICQARTSYLNSEILWGHRFNPLLFMNTSSDQMHEKFTADLALFNSTYAVPTPKCSAKESYEKECLAAAAAAAANAAAVEDSQNENSQTTAGYFPALLGSDQKMPTFTINSGAISPRSTHDYSDGNSAYSKSVISQKSKLTSGSRLARRTSKREASLPANIRFKVRNQK